MRQSDRSLLRVLLIILVILSSGILLLIPKGIAEHIQNSHPHLLFRYELEPLAVGISMLLFLWAHDWLRATLGFARLHFPSESKSPLIASFVAMAVGVALVGWTSFEVLGLLVGYAGLALCTVVFGRFIGREKHSKRVGNEDCKTAPQ